MSKPDHNLEVGQRWQGENGGRTILYIGPGNQTCAFIKWTDHQPTGDSLMGSQRSAFHQWIKRGKAVCTKADVAPPKDDTVTPGFAEWVKITLANIENRLAKLERGQ